MSSEILDSNILEFIRNPPESKWESVDIEFWRQSISQNFKIILILQALYLSGTYYGQKFMQDRKPFNLKNSLILWNAALSIFSGIVAFKSWMEFARVWHVHGYYAICNRVPLSESALFWGVAFLLSKVIELGDTIFLVLRGKKVIFLHWFHHAAVLFTAFYIFPKLEPMAALCTIANSTVHTFMYFYYAMMAAGIKIPKILGLIITSIQVTQFIIGMSFYTYSLYNKYIAEEFCELSNSTIFLSLQGFVYLILFTQIFVKNYNSLISNKKK